MRFSLLGQAAVCKQQLLVGTSFAAFASGWIRKLTCSAVPPLQSKPAALGFALVPGEGDARLRPEWRQGIRKDRAANPVFSDITFKWRKEAQSLRRCAPPPFTQGRLYAGAANCFRQRGRHNPSGAARHLPLHKGGMGAALSVAASPRHLSQRERREGATVSFPQGRRGVPDKFSGRWWLWGAADV